MIKHLAGVLLVMAASQPLFAADSLNDKLSSARNYVPSLNQTAVQPRVLAPEQAFGLQVSLKNENEVKLNWNIANGYYLYQDKIKITTSHLLNFDFPEGNKITDEFFGEQTVYFNKLTLSVSLPKDLPTEFSLMVTYQGCATAGFCYPPISETWKVDRKTGLIEVTEEAHASGAAELAEISALSEASAFTLTELLSDTQSGWVWIIFYLLGLLLAFTPCVLPMFPILSSIIVGHHAPERSTRAFFLSLSYVGGMAITYSLAGVFAGLAGQTLQSFLQTPFFVGACALLLVVLALNSFGCYQLQMPTRLHQKMSQWQNRIHGGRFISAALLGVLSALIVSPCVTAPLIGALTYISTTGDTWIGGTSLLALALGMGTPLLVIGSFGAHLLPRSGNWLIFVQRLFGVLLVGVAIWLVGRLMSTELMLTLWGIFAIVSAYCLLISNARSGYWGIFWKFIGWLLIVIGVVLFLRALQPFLAPHLFPVKNTFVSLQQFNTVKTSADLQQEIHKSLKPVMVDVYADWCVTCKIIESQVFPDPKVAELLKEFTLIRVDVTAQDVFDKELQKSLGIFAPPALLFFTPAGPELTNKRLVGEISADKLAVQLQTILNFQEKNSPTL